MCVNSNIQMARKYFMQHAPRRDSFGSLSRAPIPRIHLLTLHVQGKANGRNMREQSFRRCFPRLLRSQALSLPGEKEGERALPSRVRETARLFPQGRQNERTNGACLMMMRADSHEKAAPPPLQSRREGKREYDEP